MRRLVTSVGLALTLSLSVLSPAASADAPGADDGRTATTPAQRQATASLAVARRVLGGESLRTDPSATMALRDLWVARDALSGPDRGIADGLLARPTDGPGDPYGFGYLVPATSKCKKNVCLHWVTSTGDMPPAGTWVNKALKTFERVYKIETKRLGFRKPLKDGTAGGNKKFDFYLKELGAIGLPGYCAPETKVKRFLATSYCVLDNDFLQFGGVPSQTQLVTAAHEFFHAVQMSYDALEDKWINEATASWMEERVADGVNRNRAFLPNSSVAQPTVSLDTYGQGASFQYGNWAFFEYLSSRYGNDMVRKIWGRLAASPGAPDDYSIKGVAKALKSKGGFAKVFSAFSAGNTIPRKTYPEGGSWPAAPVGDTNVLGTGHRAVGPLSVPLNHLTSASASFAPDAGLKNKRWKLKVSIRGLSKKRGGSAYLLVDRKRGGVEKKWVKLNGRGKARAKVAFSAKRVKRVTVTLVNASTSYSCFQQQTWSCQGVPAHDNAPYTFSVKVTK